MPCAALYIFKLSTALRAGTYESAFILMEDLKFEGLKAGQVMEAAQHLFPFDVLFGNWHTEMNDWDPAKDDQQLENYTYAMSPERKVVRILMDRALGCTYPEDRVKDEKFITDFLSDNLEEMKHDLQECHRLLFGQITEKQFTLGCMRMRLTEKNIFDWLMQALDISEGLPMFDRPEVESLRGLKSVMESRIERLQNSLPYFEIQPSSEANPWARDGHGAVCSNNMMYICGGNSKQGALKDLWRFNLKDKSWKRLKDMPEAGRYSFSMHLWQDTFIVVYGGCSKTRGRKAEVVGDLWLFNLIKNIWIALPAKTDPWPDARCRHGSHLVNRGDGTADMYLVGGMDGDNVKRKDVWKLTLSLNGLEHKASWTRLPDIKTPMHRCFPFVLTNKDNNKNCKVFVIGGFGESFRKLKEVGGSGETLVTHDMLRMPASERYQFLESDSLAGFGAVYDDVGERLILVGGGNMGRPRSGNNGSRPFGNVAAQVKSDSRILSLSHSKDSEGRSEWIWQAEGKYQSLDREDKLPNLLSWSAVYIDHSVILFGGRKPNNDEWSDKIFKVQLHPMYNEALERIRQSSKNLNRIVELQSRRFREQPKKIGLREAAVSELRFLPRTPLQVALLSSRKRCEMETLRLFSLNVHGWSNPERSALIDHSLASEIAALAPDVCCLQEVKHPFPAEPADGDRVVRVSATDRSALLRYGKDESAQSIKARLNIRANVGGDVEDFFADGAKRRDIPYLQKVFQDNDKVTVKPVTETSLSRISAAMNLTQRDFHFERALDETFGNAIVGTKAAGEADGMELRIGGRETRSACRMLVDIGSNWSLAVINVHLDEKCEEARLEQMRMLLDYLDENVPHILCGDFNALSAWTPQVERLRKTLGFQAPTDQAGTTFIGFSNFRQSKM